MLWFANDGANTSSAVEMIKQSECICASFLLNKFCKNRNQVNPELQKVRHSRREILTLWIVKLENAFLLYMKSFFIFQVRWCLGCGGGSDRICGESSIPICTVPTLIAGCLSSTSLCFGLLRHSLYCLRRHQLHLQVSPTWKQCN